MNKLGVDTVCLSSTQDYESEVRHIFDRLYNTTAHDGIKLLYVTPEKLSKSGQVKNMIQRLNSRGLISRFVVDEAHCLR